MISARGGTIIVTGNTSALRGRPSFAGFAPTKAAQRILTEAMARELGPKGVHVAYIVIDAVIDVPWTRERYKDKPDDFFIKPAAIAEEAWHLRGAGSECLVLQCRTAALRRELVNRPWSPRLS